MTQGAAPFPEFQPLRKPDKFPVRCVSIEMQTAALIYPALWDVARLFQFEGTNAVEGSSSARIVTCTIAPGP